MSTPLNGAVEVARPERFLLDELRRRGLSARNDPREVIADPNARYFGAELSERTLIPCDAARLGRTRLEDWRATYDPEVGQVVVIEFQSIAAANDYWRR